MGKVKKGTKLKVTGKSGNWYEVNYNGQVGYCSVKYLVEVKEQVTPVSGQAKVTATNLNLRAGAGTG